jgi:hypothetical protein
MAVKNFVLFSAFSLKPPILINSMATEKYSVSCSGIHVCTMAYALAATAPSKPSCSMCLWCFSCLRQSPAATLPG